MLHQRLSQITEAYPSKVAIVCSNQLITYNKLYAKTIELSLGMHDLGIQPSDMVVILLPNCFEFVLSLLALASLHAIVLPLNPLLKEEEVKRFLQEKRIKAIITDLKHAIHYRVMVKSLGLSTEIIVIDDFSGSEKSFQSLLVQEHSRDNLPQLSEIYEGDVLYHYSSGSAGQPKGLYRTQKQLFHEAHNFTQTANITDKDVILCAVPLFHAHGLGNALLAALFSGATLVILNSLTQDNPFIEVPFVARCAHVFELIARYQVTVFPGAPDIFEALATDEYAAQADMSSLRLCFSAGNPLPQTVFQHFLQCFGIPVRQLYGCTEAGSISINLAQADELIADSVGKPIMGVDILIVDGDMEAVASGSSGEIAIKSLALTTGYEHRSDLNGQAFREGYFLTGDLGRINESGYLFITGRRRIFIDTGGYKVDLCQVADKPASAQTLEDFSAIEKLSYAGVSAFGLSGTNAHVILEEAPFYKARENKIPADLERPLILPLSARSPQALHTLLNTYESYLSGSSAMLSDICYSASVRRSHHTYRAAVVGRSKSELLQALHSFQESATFGYSDAMPKTAEQIRKIIFVCPGQGSQWVGMGRELLAQEPVFHKSMLACEEAMKPFVSWSLIQCLVDPAFESISPIEVIQPTLFAFQVSLAALWSSWGIEPDVVVGHSMGEVAAAHLSGALSLADAALIICRRSQLLKHISGQSAMLLVELPLDQAQKKLSPWVDRISIAVSNSPRSTVLAGDPTAISELLISLEQQQVFCNWVKVDVASHSPQVDQLHAALIDGLAPICPQLNTIPMYSTVTGQFLDGTQLLPEYWFDNLRQPVHFSRVIKQLIAEDVCVFVELSPYPILVTAIEENLSHWKKQGLVLASLRRDREERGSLFLSLAKLYTRGFTINWSNIFTAAQHNCVTLPAYPWQHERFWIDLEGRKKKATRLPATRVQSSGHPFLDRPVPLAPSPDQYYCSIHFDGDAAAYLQDHRVHDVAVLPAAAYIDLIMEAAKELLAERKWFIEHLHFKEMLLLAADMPISVELIIKIQEPQGVSFQFYSQERNSQDVTWVLHADGFLLFQEQEQEDELLFSPRMRNFEHEELSVAVRSREGMNAFLESIEARCQMRMGQEEYYTLLAMSGLQYGPSFRGIQQIWRRDGEALAYLVLQEEDASDVTRYQIHPALLDAMLQTLTATMSRDDETAKQKKAYLPIQIDQVYIHQKVGSEAWAHSVLRSFESLEDQSLVGDISLFDVCGELLLEIRGLHV